MNEKKSYDAYLIRHTDGLDISDKDLKELYEQRKIAIHFPTTNKDKNNIGTEDIESLNPDEYKKTSYCLAIRRFTELAKNGGYVWVEYRTESDIIIGKIKPNSTIEINKNYKWRKNPDRIAKLKTLQLDKNKLRFIKPDEAMSLKAARPIKCTISPWKKGNQLRRLFNGENSLPAKWENLSPDQQETICAEFLRENHPKTGIPKLKYLLLPVGRTMKDIDIWGLTDKNKNLFAQITFSDDPKSIADKNERLQACHRKGKNELLLFYPCGKIRSDNDILCIPTEMVEAWLLKIPTLKKACFSLK
jgi:hypothetical protein